MRTDLYWIEGPWRGRLAILPRPRGGDWLEDEIKGWHEAGLDVVLSALTSDENAELDLLEETAACAVIGIAFISFPIEDRGVPDSMQTTAELVQWLESKLVTGGNVAIHCRQGVGRSALLASSVLVASGISPKAAFERIEKARGCGVPDTPEQREWVDCFARASLQNTQPIQHKELAWRAGGK